MKLVEVVWSSGRELVMETTETRRIGKHFFIFEKGNAKDGSCGVEGKNRTLIASCVNNNEEKLPQEFVNYMRMLFDILDVGRSGFVKLSDIEARWGRKNGHFGAQPSDVLQNLRKVAPQNGLLSFERLCLGFQLALRPTAGKKEDRRKLTVQEASKDNRCEGNESSAREHGNKGDTKTVKNNDLPLLSSPHRRPRSMLQLRQQKELDLSVAKRKGGILEGIQKTDKNTVIDKLRQWKTEELRKKEKSVVKEVEKTAKTSSKSLQREKGSDSEHRPTSKRHSTTNESRMKLPRVRVYYQGQKPNGLNGGSRDSAGVPKENKTIISKESKLKDLEEELKVLGDGLSTVEEVRDWLFTRITAIQEEKLYVKSVDRYLSQDYEAMAHLIRRKELGLNSAQFKTFPKHMKGLKSYFHQTLQKPLNSSSQDSPDSESQRKVAQLEKEKSALIREVFQYKSQTEKTLVCGK